MTPISDHGPFRVSRTGVEYQKRVTYAPSGPRWACAAATTAGGSGALSERGIVAASAQSRDKRPVLRQLLVAAEPRLALSQVQPLELTEATLTGATR